MERAERRYVAGGAASRSAGRGGAISRLATPAAAHAPRADVTVGRKWQRSGGFRHLDEARHGIYRPVVAGARLENYPADDTAGGDRPRGALKSLLNFLWSQ